jgi:hypothetical protein
VGEQTAPKPPANTDWIVPAGEGWVRRTERERHECARPSVTGQYGDLWRCRCGRLWRVGRACAICDERGAPWPHGGQCTLGAKWRHATWWQRLRHRRR